MRAVVVETNGPPSVARIADVPDPSPTPDGVVVEVRAVAATAGDARMRGARFPRGFGPFARLGIGLRRPRRRVLGMSASGVVREVGSRVTAYDVGDEVVGMLERGLGAHAELVAAPASELTRKPAAVSHEDAAGILSGGTTALHFRDRARIAAGDRVLVLGAAGAVGTNVVQLAHLAGAHVTAYASGGNAELLRRIGADAVIDRARVPVDAIEERFDVVTDTVGAVSIAQGRRLLSEGGVLQLVAADLWQTVGARGRVHAGVATPTLAAIDELMRLAEAGDLVAVNQRVLALSDIVAAYELVDSGHKVGNVVLVP